MARNLLLLTFAGLLLVAVPAAAAPPFGSFGGLVGGGNVATGIMPLHGWALDDLGIDRVEVYVDGVPAGTAYYGFRRPDVEAVYPGYPDSATAGFGIELNSTLWLNGFHTLSAVVVARDGERTTLGESYQLQFNNASHLLPPFGEIEFPHSGAQLFGHCDLRDRNRRYSVIDGFAVDTGVELGDTGVKYVELLINGAIYANSVTDCFYSAATGGMTNCFGLPRTDIRSRYPSIPNALHAGYRFVLDVGVLVELGFNQGFHELTVRAGDYYGNVANIAEIPVVFLCDENQGNQGAYGEIELPVPLGIYAGEITFTGWTLDWEGVNQIHMFVDGNWVGTAVHGFPRPGVSARYPGFPESAGPGWAFDLDAAAFTDGLHLLQVVVEDDLGVETVLGEVPFLLDSYHGGGGAF